MNDISLRQADCFADRRLDVIFQFHTRQSQKMTVPSDANAAIRRRHQE
jgi:hypothetical protein